MTPAQTVRWEQIRSFSFDPPGAVIGFADKLAQETGWTRAFALEAIEEYRRFLLLAATAGHPVSPPPTVDQVWHLHLLYTRNYWRELCPKVLGFDLHHEPATGTADDRAHLDDGYARTLRSYRDTFGRAPPEDVWPAHPRPTPIRHVDPQRYLVISRAAWRLGIVLLVTVLAVLSITVVVLMIRHGQ